MLNFLSEKIYLLKTHLYIRGFKLKHQRLFHVLIIFNLIVLLNPLMAFSNIQSCENELVIMDFFPIDLDLLYCQDDPVMLNDILNDLGNASGILPISPYGGYFTGSHIEGSDKLYFDSLRQLEMFAPHNGESISLSESSSSTIDNVEGNDVVTDVQLGINLGMDCGITYGHLTLLKPIFDEIESTGSYSFSKGEHIGYQTDSGAGWYVMDFWYYNATGSICPIQAFNDTIKTKVNDLYDIQYQRMALSGLYPQGKLCTNMSIHIDDTFWGTWKYKTGPFDAYVHSTDDEGYYSVGFMTLFNRDFTNSDTYWKDIRPPQDNLTDQIIGIFGDNYGATSPPGYNATGRSHIKQVVGGYVSGILELCTFHGSDWSPANSSVYALVEMINDPSGFAGDELMIEYFATYQEAENGFTNNKITYTRNLHYLHNSTEETGLISYDYKSIVIHFGLIVTFIALVNFRKKKK
jgi:hypothetical protein